MEKRIATLYDSLGFEVGSPDLKGDLPTVVVWGDDFFLLNAADDRADCYEPRYHQVSGVVLDDTKEL